MERQSHDLSELFFFESFFLINLISEHDNRYILQLWHLKKSFELFFGLSKSINISGIYDEDYSVDSTCILSPCFSCLHMASQIIGIEFYRFVGVFGFLKLDGDYNVYEKISDRIEVLPVQDN